MVALASALMLALAGSAAASTVANRPRARTAACSTNVAFGLIEATTTGCLSETSPGRWDTSDTVNVNGIALVPVPGTKVVLTAPDAGAPGGTLSVDTSITVEGVTFEKRGLIDWKLPAGGKGDDKQVVSTGSVNGEKLFGFPISGSAEIRIGWDPRDNLRYFKFIGNLALPSIFKNGPEQGAGGLTATVGLRVDRDGVHADTVKAEVNNAYMGTLQVKNLCLSYVSASSTTSPCSPPAFGAQPFLECQNPGSVNRWDGSAEIVIPTADRPEVGVWAGVQGGQFSYAGGQVTHLGNSVPIATGVYLDNVALAVCVNPPPFVFKGAAGVSVGPTTNGVAPVTLNGSLQYTDSRPWVLEAHGSLLVYGNQVADGFLKYQSDNTIDFGFNVNLDFKVASLEGHVLGWIEARNPLRFNVDGSGRVCVLSVACLSGEVTASSVGLAGCFTLMEGDYWTLEKNGDWEWYAPWRTHWETHHWRVRGGVGVRWGGSVDLMGDSCDVGPYRAARSARVAAAGVYTVQVPSGDTALVLKAQGLGRAPGVELIAPDGKTYSSPLIAAKIVPGQDAFVKDPQTRATQVFIAHPAAGTWRLQALPGSVVSGVEQAQVDEVSTIRAGVGGSGENRTLGYLYQPQPLHTTRFVEEGGKDEQELGVAAGKPCPQVKHDHPDLPLCGEIRFTPAAGPAGPRHIYAVTTMNGEITGRDLVATYDAPPEPEPAEVPALSVHRVPGGLMIGFAGSDPAVSVAKPVDYDVDVNLTTGRKLVDILRSRTQKVMVTGVDPAVGAQVSVSPIREDDTQGKTRTVELSPDIGQASSS